MSKLSWRERFLVGVFCVALVWGAWNYRHLLTAGDPTPPPARPDVSTEPVRSATAAVGQQTDSASVRMTVPYEPPGWSADPFNRSWR